MSAFPEEISSGIGKRSTAGGPPPRGWAVSKQGRSEENKMLSERNLLVPDFRAGALAFLPPPGSNLHHQLLQGLEPVGLWVGTYTWFSGLQTPSRGQLRRLSWVSNWPTADLGTYQSHNCGSPFSRDIYLHTHPIYYRASPHCRRQQRSRCLHSGPA